MSDLISRQAAIDAVCKCTNIYFPDLPIMVYRADAYKALAELPSAQPDMSGYSDRLWQAVYERGKREAERKEGKWIKRTGWYEIGYKCSECDKFSLVETPYCSECGAKMGELINES